MRSFTTFLVEDLSLFNFYRPQRSCVKVMFLHLSVILFTWRGISVGLCPGRGSLSLGVSVQRGLCQGDPHTVTCILLEYILVNFEFFSFIKGKTRVASLPEMPN